MKKFGDFSQNVLSKEQQKNVVGGRTYRVSCITTPGFTQTAPGSCEGTQANCQAAANNWCASAPGCGSCNLS
jgi:hypothetical protein